MPRDSGQALVQVDNEDELLMIMHNILKEQDAAQRALMANFGDAHISFGR